MHYPKNLTTRDTTMQNGTANKILHDHATPNHSQLSSQKESDIKLTKVSNEESYMQLCREYSQMREQQEERDKLTRVFINDINGVILSILGNAELLKVKHSHNFNHEAANYLHKVEDNSENLITLLNSFHATIYPDKQDIVDIRTATLPDSAISEA